MCDISCCSGGGGGGGGDVYKVVGRERYNCVR